MLLVSQDSRRPAPAKKAARSCCSGLRFLFFHFELCGRCLHACVRGCRSLEALKQRLGSLERRVRVQLIRRGAGKRSGEEKHCDRNVFARCPGGGRRVGERERQSRSIADAWNARARGRAGSSRTAHTQICPGVHLLSAALSSSNVRAFAMPAEGKTPARNEGRARGHAGARGSDGVSPNAHSGFTQAPHLQICHLTGLLHVHRVLGPQLQRGFTYSGGVP